ncbi:hypothetical protein Tco_1180170, partial [Tanacetum coccineum]
MLPELPRDRQLISLGHISNSLVFHTLWKQVYPKSEMIVFHNEDGNPARANLKQALG